MGDHHAETRVTGSGDATVLLTRVTAGDETAAGELLPIVYAQLRAMAGAYLRNQRSDHTLQPTALVHEAYLKMVAADADWRSKAHFCAIAATAMRQILSNHARDKARLKRGGPDKDEQRVSLSAVESPSGDEAIDLVALEHVLSDLASRDERRARIVEMSFFGGMTSDEIGEVIGVSGRTVKREWRLARAWMRGELQRRGAEPA